MRPLRSNQVEAFKYSLREQHPALFMEMRLGKSLVVIRRCNLYKPRDAKRGLRVLVIAPGSALGSWWEELTLPDKEGVDENEVVWLQGKRAERVAALQRNDATWYLLNREGFQILPEIAGMTYCDSCAGKGYTLTKELEVGDRVSFKEPDEEAPAEEKTKKGKKRKGKKLKGVLVSIENVGGVDECYKVAVDSGEDVECEYEGDGSCVQQLERESCSGCRGSGRVKLPDPPIGWDVVVIDESPFIKTPAALVTKFATKNFREVPHRWILAGRPNPENDLEYFSQFQFLDGSFCGSLNYYEHRGRFYKPGWDGYGWEPKKGTDDLISAAVGSRAFIQRRKDVGMEKEKILINRWLKMPVKLRKAYDQLEQDFVLQFDGMQERSTIWRTTQYVWLRQMCGGWLGKEQCVWDGKVRVLSELLEGELKGEQVVVWYNFNNEITASSELLLRKHITCATMTGKTKKPERERRRREFQKGNIQVLLIQQAVAQMGMDLSAADTAIYFSEPTGFLARTQTEDRILSVAKDTPLLFIHLLVKNSVDVDVRNALAAKEHRNDLSLNNALKVAMRLRWGGEHGS